MAKYKRLKTGYYARRYDHMIESGFEPFEAQELVYGAHYRTFKRNRALGKQDPALYLQRMIKWRKLYVGNLKRAGKSPEQIHNAIMRLYERKKWLTHPEHLKVPGVRRDPLAMLRSFRHSAIASGEYVRPPKKGSHHKILTKGAVSKQGKKRAKRTALQRYAEGRGKE